MYDALDPFLQFDSWHSGLAPDRERFSKALSRGYSPAVVAWKPETVKNKPHHRRLIYVSTAGCFLCLPGRQEILE